MSALAEVVRSGVGRRRVQALVIGFPATMAVAASVLGGSLLVISGAPFDDAFAQQRGAHLSVDFDAGRVSAGQLSKSKDTTGVSGAAGPFRTATVTPQADEEGPGWPMTVVGRSDPGRDVDEVALIDGRWPARSGEIVLSVDSSLIPNLGRKVTFTHLPDEPTLTVVGVARSVTRTADAWVEPAQMPALTPSGSGGYQMLYRFTNAGTAAQITAGGEAVTRSLAPGAAVGKQSWLTVRKDAERDTALYVSFLIAFGTLGLVMSALIVGNVVASAVGTATRRIGILKAVGFTPAQVVDAYIGQALIPAGVGTGLGVLVGHLLAVPVMAETEEVYGSSSPAIAPWVDVTVFAGVLGLVTATACGSAWRAGRLRTVDALAVGRAAPAERGRWAVRPAGWLPLPRPVALGLARPFARPARALAMGTTILFGAVAVTFTVGMGATLGKVMDAKAHDVADVTVPAPMPDFGPQPPGGREQPKADQAAVADTVETTPGTGKYYRASTVRSTVSGLTGTVDVVAFTGDASWGGYTMVAGRWIDSPGEAVVPTPFLTATGTHIGDSITLNGLAEPVRIRVVGEVLDPRNSGMQVFTDVSTLAATHPDLTDTSHHIAVTSGSDVAAYGHRTEQAFGATGGHRSGRRPRRRRRHGRHAQGAVGDADTDARRRRRARCAQRRAARYPRAGAPTPGFCELPAARSRNPGQRAGPRRPAGRR
ncbi:ABC transporter permease [Streptomyces sp. NPDC086010]|uniref:ABC transporter permease n=1 Tax=Streptomyces sp. NPDC086010 TaxID=3365745 RepID=UPI0037D10CE7